MAPASINWSIIEYTGPSAFKPNKKIKTAYDRRKTLDVSIDKKERIAKRQEEIKLLEQQLKQIEEERNDIESFFSKSKAKLSDYGLNQDKLAEFMEFLNKVV